jgi:hypothetical protein
LGILCFFVDVFWWKTGDFFHELKKFLETFYSSIFCQNLTCIFTWQKFVQKII